MKNYLYYILEAAKKLAIEHGADKNFNPGLHFIAPYGKVTDLPEKPNFTEPACYNQVMVKTVDGVTYLKHEDDTEVYILARDGNVIAPPFQGGW